MNDTRLPIEDVDAGLYIHQKSDRMPSGTRVMEQWGPEGQTTYWVRAEDFMEVQRDRDEWRRVCALINAWRVNPARTESRLRKLLARVGLTNGDAHAMADLVAEARTWSKEAAS